MMWGRILLEVGYTRGQGRAHEGIGPLRNYVIIREPKCHGTSDSIEHVAWRGRQ